ncbi:MAG: glycosyltransferase [Magnetococcales bacterium]|nr:glycosyltransferase [Magnetococcales bacterium]
MIAFHYPPAQGYSGIQRGLKFSSQLPEFGWEPLVLSAHPRAYAQVGPQQMEAIPPGLTVRRAFALDALRHLSIGGRYPRLAALPDRWASWWLGGVPAGLALIRRFRPRALWSTQPIPTAHLIGRTLARLTGLPWVADFRDAMLTDTCPADPLLRRLHLRLEQRFVTAASRVVVTTPGLRSLMGGRHPQLPAERWAVIPNGYDEDDFRDLPGHAPRPLAAGEPVVLLHSGRFYPRAEERDPRPFLQALSTLRQQGTIAPETLQVVLRAPGMEDILAPAIQAGGLERIVQIKPLLPYREALREMTSVHGLLLFQGAEFGHHIPAKLFEYLRSGRPILALTEPDGDTARLLREAHLDGIVPMCDPGAIAAALGRFIAAIRAGEARGADPERVACHSRRQRAAALAGLLDGLHQVENTRGGATSGIVTS